MRDGPAELLIRWFRGASRELPWRGPFPRDPYHTLVAEIMLQQTQVARVVPAYAAFIAAFSTLDRLAEADEDEVLRHFTGLGYYRRARLLHAACRAVAARGGWPRDRGELLRLPGIGEYTSAAVAAFCFDGSEPPVDGNIVRITARIKALPHGAKTARARREAVSFARALHSDMPTPELWEALMDLGSEVCTPRAPACHECPLATSCKAGALGKPMDFPAASPARAPEPHLWAALWARRPDGAVLLRRVSSGPLLEGLWLPPFRPVQPRVERPEQTAAELARALGLDASLVPLPAVRHSITHRRIVVRAFAVDLRFPHAAAAHDGNRWEHPSSLRVGTSSLLMKLARAASAVLPEAATHPDPRQRS